MNLYANTMRNNPKPSKAGTREARKLLRLRWAKGVTAAHSEAARRNGKLGGRPKKDPASK